MYCMNIAKKSLIGEMFRDKPFMRRMLVISIPIMLQQLITTAMYMVDTVMIGGLGDIQLAGVGAANQLAYLLDIVLFGVMSGGGVYMSQYFGKGDTKGLRSTLGLSTILCLGFSVLFVIIASVFGRLIVGLYSTEAAVIDSGVEYLSIACIGYLFKAIIYPYGMAHKSSGNAKLPMISGAIALSVNIFFNYCFIFGNLGFPKLGVAGAAYATLIGSACDAGALLFFSYIKETVAKARLHELLAQTWNGVKEFISISMPAFLNDALWAIGMLVINYIYGRMGTDTFAAMMIVNTVDKLTMVGLMGVGSAAAVVLGNTLGEGDPDRAYLYGKRYVVLSVMVGIIFGVICSTVGTLMPLMYQNTSMHVQALSARTIFVMGFFMPIYAVNFTIVCGILRSGGDTRAAAWIDLIPLWLLALPITAVAGLYFKLPLDIVFLCVFPNNVVRMIMTTTRLRSKYWLRSLV